MKISFNCQNYNLRFYSSNQRNSLANVHSSFILCCIQDILPLISKNFIPSTWIRKTYKKSHISTFKQHRSQQVESIRVTAQHSNTTTNRVRVDFFFQGCVFMCVHVYVRESTMQGVFVEAITQIKIQSLRRVDIIKKNLKTRERQPFGATGYTTTCNVSIPHRCQFRSKLFHC